MAYSDKEILDQIRKGQDDKVLAYLYKTVLPKVKHMIRSNSGDHEEASDIFQDAILIFYKHVKTGKFNERHEIGGFIYFVSRNLWINYVKKKNRKTSLTDKESELEFDGNILSDLISKEREDQVMEVFSGLGDRCKELLVNTIFHKFSMKEICEKMGFSTENAAKTRHYKCKQKLIELVGNNQSFKGLLQ